MIKANEGIMRGESDVSTFLVVTQTSVDIDIIGGYSEVDDLHRLTFGRWNLPPIVRTDGFSGGDVSFEYATQSPNFLRRTEKK